MIRGAHAGIIARRRGLSDPFVIAQLPMEGDDESVTFLDLAGGTWGAGGNAKIDDGDTVFGNGSLLLDGNGDYLGKSYVGNLHSIDFTIELFFKLNGLNKQQIIFTTYANPTQANTIIFRVNSSNYLNVSNGLANGAGTVTALTTGVWYYAAMKYVVGTGVLTAHLGTLGGGTTVQQSTLTGTVSNSAAAMFLGGSPGDNNIGSNWFDGRMSSLRISRGVARDVSAVPTERFPTS